MPADPGRRTDAGEPVDSCCGCHQPGRICFVTGPGLTGTELQMNCTRASGNSWRHGPAVRVFSGRR